MINPYYAFVELTIGDLVIQGRDSTLISFECSRFTSTSNNICTVVLADETALVVENAMLSLDDEKTVKFRYGYTGGAVSPYYTGSVTECVPDLSPAGATITLTIVSKGSLCKAKPKSKAYRGTPDQVVTQVASEEGYQLGTIEPCKPVKSEEVIDDEVFNDSNDLKDKVFYRNNESAIDFIKSKVVPFAKSINTGQADYKVYFDDSTDPPTLNFHPDDWESKERVMYNLSLGVSGDSEVISFKPSMNEGLALVMGASEVTGATVDALRNEMFKVSYDKSKDYMRPVTGDYTNVPPGYTCSIGGSSFSQDEFEKMSANLWAKGSASAYPAELSVVGNPLITLQSIISIIVLTPQGLPHYSSGIYLVTSVTDTIEGGSFTTNVALIRNGLQVGTDDSGGVNITASSPPTLPSGGGSGDSTNQESTNAGGSSDVSPSGDPKRDAIINTAKQFLGLPYVWGGTTPAGFDCSGLTQYCYRQHGYFLTRTTYTQCKEGSAVDANDSSKWKVGDLLFYTKGSQGPEHVGMYVGNGKKIHAPRTGDVIKIDSANSPYIVRRIIP